MAKAGLVFQKKDEYMTPKKVVDHFGPFDYDPCTTEEQAAHLGIPNFDTEETDGLSADWTQYRRIWVNPPFTRKFEFLKKAADTASRDYNETSIFFLIPADSLVTKRFHDIMLGTSYSLHIPNKRIAFENPDGGASSPAFGSVVLELGIYGEGDIIHWRLDGEDNRE